MNDAPRGRLPGLALVSAGVLLLQLVHTRVLAPMVWHHVAWSVVTLTLLGFAAGGAWLACRRDASDDAPTVSRRLADHALLFAFGVVATYAFVTRVRPPASTRTWGLALAALQDGVLVVPMIAAGLVVARSLAAAGERVGRAYAWNMGGSALGCLLYVPALRALGGEGAVLAAAALGAAGAACLAGRADRRAATAAVVAVGTAALAVVAPTALFEVPVAPTKAMAHVLAQPGMRVERTAWDPVCRVDVVGPGPDAPDADRLVFQDGGAPTVLPLGSAEERYGLLAEPGLGYLLFEDSAPDVLAIGIGGGVDIVMARAPRTFPDGSRVRFTGVEINAATVGLMRGEYAERTGHRYTLPDVTVHHDEGRSWLRRSEGRFDLLQLSGADTYTALASGSLVLTESYLYTAEALDDMLAHLTDRGAICALRFLFEPPRECLRFVALAVDALRRAGAEAPERHVLVIGAPGREAVTAEGRTVGVGYGAVIITREPLRPGQVARYEELDARTPYELLAAPGVARDGVFADYLDAVAAGTDDAFRAAYPFDVGPVTDDLPFFFRFHRWGDVWRALVGAAPRARDADDPAVQYLDFIGEAPVALVVLLLLLAGSAAAVAALVALPLAVFRRRGLAVAGRGRLTLLFGGLGAGYMLVEVAALQRFVLYLGRPGLALPVVLGTFLVASALGAAWAGRRADPRRTLAGALVVVPVLLTALVVVLPVFFAATLDRPLPVRAALAALVLAPAGFAMGVPFPCGLAWVRRRAEPWLPWAFGVNGALSVLASVLAVLGALAAGFRAVFVLGALAYVASLVAARGLPSGSEGTGSGAADSWMGR